MSKNKKINKIGLLYLYAYDGNGVENKIDGFCHAAQKSGFMVSRISEECRGFIQRKKLVSKMLSYDGKYIVVRSFTAYNIFFLHIFLQARLQGKIVILDQPSPLCTYLQEVTFKERSFLWKIMKWSLVILGGPFGFMPFHRIIQYAEESWYFHMFSRKKMLLVGNGVDADRISLRRKEYPDGESMLRLVGVASNISGWHGFDRIIRAMAEWRKIGKRPKVFFDIVGNDSGKNAEDLKLIIRENGLTEDVHFWGLQDNKWINDFFSKESLAVSSLGLFRKGLNTASVLKAREYCMAGIPFISAGNDPDFPQKLNFRFNVSNNDSIDDILDVFESFHKRRKSFTDEQIREYAVKHLSFDSKFKEVIEGL